MRVTYNIGVSNSMTSDPTRNFWPSTLSLLCIWEDIEPLTTAIAESLKFFLIELHFVSLGECCTDGGKHLDHGHKNENLAICSHACHTNEKTLLKYTWLFPFEG